MALIWTPEKIAKLSLEEIKQLAKNAQSKEAFEIASWCEVEIQARKPKPKPKASYKLADGIEKVARTAVARALEKDAIALLVQVAQKLEATFDLSSEKARSLSHGTKGFMPHRLLNSDGSAKVGGAQRAGAVVFDRYISYRLGTQIYALLCLLRNGDDVTNVQYQVVGPKEILNNAQPISELRPYLPPGSTIGLTDFAEEFNNFEEAAERFMFLMEQVAPKR